MKSPRGTQVRPLQQLARLYGVETSYRDVFGHRWQASPEALLAVLRALGAPAERLQEVPAVLAARRQALGRQCMEPVVVAWDGGPTQLELQLPAEWANAAAACRLDLETGDVRRLDCDLARLPTLAADEVGGVRYVAKRFALPGRLPHGYHRFTLEILGKTIESLIIAAPRKAYPSPASQTDKSWGVFLPLYALHSQRSWGAGDLSDLAALLDWVSGLGGSVVSTLPLLPAFLDEPFDPSPYAPVSRLFWNEFYIDVTRVPELQRCPAAQALLASPEVQREVRALRSSPRVDYRRQMALKRKVLEELARCFFTEPSQRYAAFKHFLGGLPRVEDYARFRAVCERQRAPWSAWPQPLQDGVLKPEEYDETAKRYHLYAQWLLHEQFEALARNGREKGAGLYLDLPLGVHPAGYDVWQERAVFAVDACGGAPPDAVFTGGQNWGFPPLHPETIRETGYRYFIACLRHHLNYARLLRLDHVMGLHRLFWIPKGMGSREGVYVRYRAEELYAILSLESHRHKAWIVGENLGTVPAYVNPTMRRHNIQRMYVAQYQLVANPRRALRAISNDSLASLNTHDMPLFAAFWQGLDIKDRLTLGLLNQTSARRERKPRLALKRALVKFFQREGLLKRSSRDAQSVIRSCLAHLAASPARAVVVNLEDLWLETQSQNVPGTGAERPNWRLKARHALEAFCQLPPIVATLREMNHLRRRGATLGVRR
ncbi:MAG: 4-alpha-glucanotransferase [Terriglobia bacterium]